DWGEKFTVLLLRSTRRSGLARGRGRFGDDVVDEAVLLGLIGSEPAVPVGVLVDLLHAVAGLLGGQFGHGALHVQDQVRVDPDVGGGTADSAGRLVHHHPGVRGRVPFARGGRGGKDRPGRGRRAPPPAGARG